jgi:hypothetical protein
MRQTNARVTAGRNVGRIFAPPRKSDAGEESVARRPLDAALDAELFLDILNTVKCVLKFLPMDHLLTQHMDVCLDSPDPRIKIV